MDPPQTPLDKILEDFWKFYNEAAPVLTQWGQNFVRNTESGFSRMYVTVDRVGCLLYHATRSFYFLSMRWKITTMHRDMRFNVWDTLMNFLYLFSSTDS
jgi:hypothetical protein